MKIDPDLWALGSAGAFLLAAGGAYIRAGFSSGATQVRRPEQELEAEIEEYQATHDGRVPDPDVLPANQAAAEQAAANRTAQ